MDKLTELAIKYKTDKWGKHHYTPHYYEMFRNNSKGHDLIYLFGNVGLDMDLVIDDGSHKPKDQVYTCMSVMPRLKKDCIYVIEDVADISILEPISKIYSTNTIECGERYDDRLIVVKHK